MAIEDSLQKALPVKEIYAWIIQHFPYFKTAPTGWKNSVRHNLSLNKCFQKVEKAAVSWILRNYFEIEFNFLVSRLESRKRVFVDGGTAVPSKFNSSSDTLPISSLLNVGETHEKSYKDTEWES